MVSRTTITITGVATEVIKLGNRRVTKFLMSLTPLLTTPCRCLSLTARRHLSGTPATRLVKRIPSLHSALNVVTRESKTVRKHSRTPVMTLVSVS